MSSAGDFGNPLRKFKLVFLGEQSGKSDFAAQRLPDALLCNVNVAGVTMDSSGD